MKQTLILVFSSFLSVAAFGADNDAELAKKIYSSCQSLGGKVAYKPDATVKADGQVCVKSTCSIDSRKDGTDCNINIDSQTVPAGCQRAVMETCGTVVPGGNSGTAGPGGNSGTTGPGGNSGATGPGGNSGTTGPGGNSGTTSTGGGGTVVLGPDDLWCKTVTGDVAIGKGHACYKECNPKTGFLGLGKRKYAPNSKKCMECMMGLGYDFTAEEKRAAGISIMRVQIKECYDANGNVVSRTSSGSCPSRGGSGSGGVVIRGGNPSGGAGSGTGAGGGVVVVGGPAAGGGAGAGGSVVIGGSAGGRIDWPAFCLTDKKKDKEKCNEWIRKNHRYICSAGGNLSTCTNGADIDILSEYDIRNCVDCQARSKEKSGGSFMSGLAEVVGAAAPIAMVGLGSYFNYKGQKAWAGAAAKGFEQCQLDHNNYYGYLAANELPGLTPAQQQAMNCNGYQLGGFGGLQNGGLGGYYGAGYTPGFIGGMMGPYGMYNPYGGGMGVGGAVGGMLAGGYVSGVAGGYVNGISIAGGVAAGMPGGYGVGGYGVGGYPAGGYVAGGIPGGYGVGGYGVGGYPAGGYVQGGYVSGIQGGYVQGGGLVNGISIAGGVAAGVGGNPCGGFFGCGQGGFQGGYVAGGFQGGFQGGYAAGGYMAGGYTPGGYAGGYMAGGYMAAGYQGGYQGGFQGGFQGGYMQGGYAAGGYMDYQASAQAANRDAMAQQQGMSFNMGMSGGGMGYGGAAGMYPANMGAGLYGQFGIGGGFGM